MHQVHIFILGEQGQVIEGESPQLSEVPSRCVGLLSCAVQQVTDKLHLSQKLLQVWQTTAQNRFFGSFKSHSSSSPSMTRCWFLSESKAWLCPSSFSYFGEAKDWYLQQKPLQRAHKPLRSADCKQVIKVKHLLKCCADTQLALPLESVGRWPSGPVLTTVLWEDSWQRKQLALEWGISIPLCTQAPTAHLCYVAWK